MLSIQELCDRYSLSRNQIYERRNYLDKQGVDTSFQKEGNKSFADSRLVGIFDEQEQWISQGGTLATFAPTVEATVIRADDSAMEVENQSPQIRISPESIQQIAIAANQVLTTIAPQFDPFWKRERLKIAVENKYVLTTAEIKLLIGIAPPNRKGFTRGSFLFYKVGKIGYSNGWRVERSHDSD